MGNNNAQGIAWFQANAGKFEKDKRGIIQKRCSEMPDDRLMMLTQMKLKNPTVVLIVGFFLGWLGIDRFMMGSWVIGLIKFFTWGFFGILWLIDLFILPGRARKVNTDNIMPYL